MREESHPLASHGIPSRPIHAAPFRLNVLGPVTVRRDGDPPASSRLTQPRPVALLCYLALARPRGLHARDTVMALLWPEDAAAHGRRALRNALYGLRRVLGPHAIRSAGDQLIGLDPDCVSCDALDLERGIRANDGVPSDVSACEPMQGLHIQGAAEFDQWMSLERDRLRALASRPASRSVDANVAPRTNQPRRPNSADAWEMHARGHYLFLRTAHGGSSEDLLRSRDYFERARALDPTFAPALAGLANFYAVAGRRGVLAPFNEAFAKVIDLSAQALAMDPSLAVPHVHFAVKALYLDDDWDRAGVEFATAVAKEPAYSEGHRFYGVWLGLVRRHDEALREMERAVSLEPDIPHMVSSLAAARIAVGDLPGAEEALRETLTLDPRHVPACDRLIRLLEEDGRFDDALAQRERNPALPGAETFRAAFTRDGAEGYRRAARDRMLAEAAALEARIRENHRPAGVNDIFSPPLVRLVTLYARLGDWRAVKSWRLQGIAARPALARWFASIPELADT